MILAPSLKLRTVAVLTVYTLLICLASCTNNRQSKSIVSLNQIELDQACGPRCLWAFMQITGTGDPHCDINCIYGLIDKKPYSATSLKDLKDAAHKLGLSATGYQLGVNDLVEMPSYAILPIGAASGTPNDPLHFILVKKATKDNVIIVNNRTLESQIIRVSSLQGSWRGYALVISAEKEMESSSKKP